MKIEDQHALDHLAASGIRLPPQPRVLLELRDKIASSDFNLQDIGRIISQDPGLVAMLFKASRSAASSRGHKFDSLDQVLQVIGIKQTYNLVQAIELSTTVGSDTHRAFERFWARSTAMAELAAMIAEDQVSVCNVFPDQAYMAGIFHECGVPILMMRFPDYCAKLRLDDASCWPGLADEDARYNVDHCTIGYLVARHWGLPDFVCAAIRYHHEIPDDAFGASKTLVCILQLAIHFYHCLNQQPNPLWNSIGTRVLEEIGIASHDVDGYCDDILLRFNAMNS